MLARQRRPCCNQFRGSALEYDFATCRTAPRSDVNEPVRMSHHGLVVRNDNYRFACVDQPVKERHQLLHISQVKADSGFIQYVNVALVTHLGCELEALALAATSSRVLKAEFARRKHSGMPVPSYTCIKRPRNLTLWVLGKVHPEPSETDIIAPINDRLLA